MSLTAAITLLLNRRTYGCVRVREFLVDASFRVLLRRRALTDVFVFMKSYRTARETHPRGYSRVWDRILWLASALNEIHSAHTDDPKGVLPCAFFPDTIGSIDTVPVYINRPQDSTMNKATYSGKYKHTVLKFQVPA
jgi:hypothetical protein